MQPCQQVALWHYRKSGNWKTLLLVRNVPQPLYHSFFKTQYITQNYNVHIEVLIMLLEYSTFVTGENKRNKN